MLKLPIPCPVRYSRAVIHWGGAHMLGATWLKSNRKKLGLSQQELGSAVGVSHTIVGSWERGKKKPAREVVATLASVLAGECATEAEIDRAMEAGLNAFWGELE
jgi:transcriptional regulator with XRE-family HTH domain